MNHLDHVTIEPGELACWMAYANGLGAIGLTLRLELDLVASDPSRHNLRRAARAARYVASIADAEQTAAINAIATQLEETAR